MSTLDLVRALSARTTHVLSGKTISGKELTEILVALMAREVAEGGPYALTPGGEDVDLGLNLLIARFLDTQDVQLEQLQIYISEQLQQSLYKSGVCSNGELHELITWYRNVDDNVETDSSVTSRDEGESRISHAIHQVADERFATVSSDLQENAKRAIALTLARNSDKQMSLMSLYMARALGDSGTQFTKRTIAEYGLANIFFWTAFIIYDDFWDEDEAAEPELLPTANLFARHYIDFFSHAASSESGFREFFTLMMDHLDAANTWEMRNCRALREGDVLYVPEVLPEYGMYDIKFYPAAGHVMGPVLMLLELGYAVESPEVQNLIAYFKHYLIGMQLNDDAHDWKEDLVRGNISTAIAALLTRWKEKYPERTEIDVVQDLPELEHLFWFEILEPLCTSILTHASQSREALYSIGCITDHAPLEEFIIRNERAANRALTEYTQSAEFLSSLTAEIS
jgi:hypothetical protein